MRLAKSSTFLTSTTALVMLSLPGTVMAQSTSTPVNNAPPVFGDIVVTATKQATTLNKVPLSVEAYSRQDLDRQSINSIADIARDTPSLAVQVPTSGDSIPSISIRGISSVIGAQTTGIYLDDTALQKRNAIGISGSGTPIPVLFDLDRVEVLRGPQGTLYGGSSEGGTVRFITPTPSLTDYQVYAKVDAATIQNGSPSYGGGVAVGVPLIKDTLAFRASVYADRNGGYIDHVNIFTGATLANNTNYQDEWAGRFTGLWQVNSDLRIEPAVYVSYSKKADSDVYWDDIGQTTVPGRTTGSYVQPTYTYGPYNTLGAYKTGQGCNVGQNYASTITPCVGLTPRINHLTVPSLSIEQKVGNATIKSISSFISDKTTGNLDYSFNQQGSLGGSPFVANLPVYTAVPIFSNRRQGYSEELRGSFRTDDGRLNIVGGLYYSHFRTVSQYVLYQTQDAFTMATMGVHTVTDPYNNVYHRYQVLKEDEFAGFGEVTYELLKGFKLIGGARVSGDQFKYYQNTAGVLAGFTVPTTANGGLTNGKLKETPITPKFGAQFQIDDRNMIYATAAKGYRIGGVNQPPPAVRCASDLQNLGITSTPGTYKSDHLWSYEVGAKTRTADNRLEVNGSAFYIKWKNIQTAFELPDCGFGYTVNAAAATSRGFDLHAALLIVPGLRVTGQVAYTDTYYTANVPIPNTPYLIIAKGDKLPVAPWTVNASIEYNRAIGDKYKAYARMDYQYSSRYKNSDAPQTVNYNPDAYWIEASHYATARVGVVVGGFDLSLYVDNLFDSKDILGRSGGRSSCENTSCSVYDLYTPIYRNTTFQPRTVGFTGVFRY